MALRATPDHRLHYEVAVAAYQIGDSPRLQKQLRAAIRLAPTYSDGHFELANALQTDGRAAETEHHLREAARFAQPGSDVAMIYNNLGNVLVDVGDQRGALAAYESGRRIAPTHGYVLNGLGNLYTDTGRPDEAVRTFRRAVRADPAGAHFAWYNMGNVLRKQKRGGEAEHAFRRALRSSPADHNYLQGLGAIAHEQHRIREAISSYRAALASRDAARAPSAPLYRDLAAAMREVYLLQEAEVMARRSLSLAPTDKEGMRQLKAVLGENGKYEESGHVGETEARLDVRQERGGATAAALDAIAAAKQRRRKRKKGGAARGGPGGGRRLAIFCRKVYSGEKADGTWEWGPRAKERGIGGSESAVISVSKELANLGWAVEVYGNPPLSDIRDHDGVEWLPFWAYDDDDDVAVFVAWRFAETLPLASKAGARYLWLHDEVRPETIPRLSLPHLRGGGVLVLSEFHEGQLPTHAMPLARRTSNGLDDAAMVDGPNDNMRFLYASSASAGLLLLLRMWAKVREAVGDGATLHVYYGFWPYAMWEEQPHLRELRRQIEPLLNESNGVHYYGMRSEAELAEAYAAAGWYAYPSDKPETSGIALMKAQACGCVPLTSGQRMSALTETVGEWDAGTKGRAGKIADDAQWQKEFVAAMIAAARRPQSEMVEYRRKMKAQARKRFSWATVARQWTEEYFGAAGGAAAATPPPPTPAPPAATKAPPTARRARARGAARRRHRGGPGGGGGPAGGCGRGGVDGDGGGGGARRARARRAANGASRARGARALARSLVRLVRISNSSYEYV